MEIYTTFRRSKPETLGAFSSYENALNAINEHLQNHEDSVVNVQSSDAEGWMSIETEKDFYFIFVVELDKALL